jgi:hypothetical protein
VLLVNLLPFFTSTINVYNYSRSNAEEKLDIYNLEYEYWSKKAFELMFIIV